MLLDKLTIIRAFELLNERLAAREQHAEIFLVGGAVMCVLASCWRRCSMTIHELLRATTGEPERWQLYVNAFVDDVRRASDPERAAMIADGLEASGRMEGLIAATVSALCRETGVPAPDWVRGIHSPEPFFVLPATSFALRMRLMLESPAPFRIRNVFVPETYLSRA